MAGAVAHQSSQFVEGKYRDLRDSSRYHTDPKCPIGSKIPGQFVHPGPTPNAKLCRHCAAARAGESPSLYRV